MNMKKEIIEIIFSKYYYSHKDVNTILLIRIIKNDTIDWDNIDHFCIYTNFDNFTEEIGTLSKDKEFLKNAASAAVLII